MKKLSTCFFFAILLFATTSFGVNSDNVEKQIFEANDFTSKYLGQSIDSIFQILGKPNSEFGGAMTGGLKGYKFYWGELKDLPVVIKSGKGKKVKKTAKAPVVVEGEKDEIYIVNTIIVYANPNNNVITNIKYNINSDWPADKYSNEIPNAEEKPLQAKEVLNNINSNTVTTSQRSEYSKSIRGKNVEGTGIINNVYSEDVYHKKNKTTIYQLTIYIGDAKKRNKGEFNVMLETTQDAGKLNVGQIIKFVGKFESTKIGDSRGDYIFLRGTFNVVK